MLNNTEIEKMRGMLQQGVQVAAVPQLFPTPASIARLAVDRADIQPGHRVLEPEHGLGNISAVIREVMAYYQVQEPESAHIDLVGVEINNQLVDMAVRFGYNVRQADFLALSPGELGQFHRIVMNPPFKNGADIRHIQHALGFLFSEGRLSAICADGPRQQKILKPLALDSGGSWEPLPAGSFKEQGTDVPTVLLTIEA